MTRTVTWETLTNHTSRVVISEPPTEGTQGADTYSRWASSNAWAGRYVPPPPGGYCPFCGHVTTYVAVGLDPITGYAAGMVPYGGWLSSVAGGSLP